MKQLLFKGIILLFLTIVPQWVYSDIITGSCGPFAMYTLDKTTGLLSISGSGIINSYSSSSSPLYNHRRVIKKCFVQNGITSLGNNLFYHCDSLKYVELPNTLNVIGDSVFLYCSKLSQVNIPVSVTQIGNSAFYSTAIESANIPSSTIKVGDAVFCSCEKLKRLSIPSRVLPWFMRMFNRKSYQTIFPAYYYNYDWEYSLLPLDKLTITGDSIDISYFQSVSVSNPKDASTGKYIRGCGGYTAVLNHYADTIIIKGASYFKNRENAMSANPYFKSAKAVYVDCSNANDEGHMSLPFAFSGLMNLNFMAIPFNRVQLLGMLFTSNYSQSNGEYQTITQYTEDGKTKNYIVPRALDEVVVAEGTEQIAYGCFSNCSMLKRLTLPSTLNGVKEKALYGCDGLTDIYTKRALPPVAYSGTFEGVNHFACTLHVPYGSKQYYERATGWKDFYFIEEEAPITISTTKNIEAGGEIIGLTEFQYGDKVELEAIAHSGYTFSAWTENGNV